MNEGFVLLREVYDVIKAKQLPELTGVNETVLMESFIRICLNHFRTPVASSEIARSYVQIIKSTSPNVLFDNILIMQLTPLVEDFRLRMSYFSQTAPNFRFYFKPGQTIPNGFFIRY